MLGELSVVEQRYLAVREVLDSGPRSPMWLSVMGLIVALCTVGWSDTPMVVWVLLPTAARSRLPVRIRSPLRWRR